MLYAYLAYLKIVKNIMLFGKTSYHLCLLRGFYILVRSKVVRDKRDLCLVKHIVKS